MLKFGVDRPDEGDALGAAERGQRSAALFLTTEAVVADKPEKEKRPRAAMPGGGGDMDF